MEHEKELVLKNSIAESRNIGAIVAANLDEVLGRTELYAKIGQSLLAGESAAAKYLNPLLTGDSAYLRVAIFDENGVLRHSSANRTAEPELAPAVKAFAASASGGTANAVHIGSPAARDGSAWRVPLVMPIHSAGERLGYFAAIMDLGYFLNLYKEVALGEGGRIEILSQDGYQFAELNGITLSAGQDFRRGEYGKFLSASPAFGLIDAIRPDDQVHGFGIFHKLEHFPLTVVVSRDRHLLLQALASQHRAYLLRAVFISIVFVCLTFGLIYLVSRRHRLYNVLAHSEQEKRSLITQLESEKSRAMQLASHDYLTGIPNRMLFYELAASELARARRSRNYYACLFLDLDKFKLINDTLGHAVGDRLLQVASARLRANLRDYDLLARLGGDEFVILVSEIATEEAVAGIAAKLVEAICQPFHDLEGHDVEVSPSIGIALYPRDGQDVETLVTHADTAMYNAKQAGSATYRFFDASLNASTVLHNELLARFRRAIKEDEFCLHFQPRVALQNFRVAGIEALVRWQHPEHGLVYPGDFIGLAEDNDLIVPLGNWVVDAVCRQLAIWRNDGIPVVPVAINVSPRQLGDDALPETVRQALERYGVPAALLEIEVTENCLFEDFAHATEILGRLQRLGLKIALDDYGIGFSGLNNLKKLPLHSIKIDRSFIRDIRNDPSDVVIVASTIALAHNLGLNVVAEGVESVDQLVHLKTAGCDEVQGFYFQRPVPAAEIANTLLRRKFDLS